MINISPPFSLHFWRVFCLLLSACLPAVAFGQNLVPNGGFELYDTCPTSIGTISFSNPPIPFPDVQSWVKPTAATSDYFNTCAFSTSKVSVPDNLFGYQPAHSGNGYAGIYPYAKSANGNGGYREYLSVRLVQPLKRDSFYCVRFFAAPGAAIYGFTRIAISALGINFSDILATVPSPYYGSLNIPFHIRNDSSRMLTDTALWYEISGVYKAHGGEEWLTVGCFGLKEPEFVNIDGSEEVTDEQAYYYIDDVSVEPIAASTQSDSTHDTLAICPPIHKTFELSSIKSKGKYQWSTGDTTRKLLVNKPGIYTCKTDFECQFHFDRFIVIKDNTVAPVVHDTMICQHIPAPRLSVDGPGLVWYKDATSDPGRAVQPLINTVKGDTITLYVARQNRGCLSKKVPLTITIKELPQPHPAEIAFRCDDGTQSYLILGAKEAADEKVRWSSGESSCCIQPQQVGRYIREARNICGSTLDTFYLTSRECDSCLVFPNAFSPNGDGINEGFGALELCPIKTFRMMVFNRWGERVYVSEELKGRWDGLHNGKPASADTYMYMVQFTTGLSEKQYVARGSVILFR